MTYSRIVGAAAVAVLTCGGCTKQEAVWEWGGPGDLMLTNKQTGETWLLNMGEMTIEYIGSPSSAANRRVAVASDEGESPARMRLKDAREKAKREADARTKAQAREPKDELDRVLMQLDPSRQ